MLDPRRRQRTWQQFGLVCGHLPHLFSPVQCSMSRWTNPGLSFSLGKERTRQHIEHPDFSRCFPRVWFLFHFFQSATGPGIHEYPEDYRQQRQPFESPCRHSSQLLPLLSTECVGKKSSAPSFSLGRERVAQHIKCYNFSHGCLRDWLLSPLSQSDDGTWHILDAQGSLITKTVVWTNTQVLTTPAQRKQEKNPSSQLHNGEGKSCSPYPVFQLLWVLSKGLDFVSPVSGHWWNGPDIF